MPTAPSWRLLTQPPRPGTDHASQPTRVSRVRAPAHRFARSTGEVQRALARSSLFRRLEAGPTEQLLREADERVLPPRSCLLRQGDVVDCLLLLVTGQAKEACVTSAGDELILSVLGPGDVAGLAELPWGVSALTSVSTLERARVLVLPASSVRRIHRSSPEFVAAIAAAEGELLRERTAQAVEWTTASATERVARRIDHLADRFGEATERGVEVPLPLTQEGLAAWACVSREVAVRELAALRADGLIETGRCRILVLDREGLHARFAQG